MFKSYVTLYTVCTLCFAVFLLGCSPAGSAADAVTGYLEALVARDLNRMTNLSCAAWEPQARLEFDSFAAVKLNTQDLGCKQVGQDQNYTLVTCTGSIIANYGAEDLQIDVAGRTYQVVQEGSEWRMCGYH
jgi:hypothetical protein